MAGIFRHFYAFGHRLCRFFKTAPFSFDIIHQAPYSTLPHRRTATLRATKKPTTPSESADTSPGRRTGRRTTTGLCTIDHLHFLRCVLPFPFWYNRWFIRVFLCRLTSSNVPDPSRRPAQRSFLLPIPLYSWIRWSRVIVIPVVPSPLPLPAFAIKLPKRSADNWSTTCPAIPRSTIHTS